MRLCLAGHAACAIGQRGSVRLIFSLCLLDGHTQGPQVPSSYNARISMGASHVSPGISIGRTAIVVVRTPYIWSYVSVLLYQWDFGLGNLTRDMFPIFWSPNQGAGSLLLDIQFKVGSEPPGARKTLRKNPLVLDGIRTRAAWLAVWHSTHRAIALLDIRNGDKRANSGSEKNIWMYSCVRVLIVWKI